MELTTERVSIGLQVGVGPISELSSQSSPSGGKIHQQSGELGRFLSGKQSRLKWLGAKYNLFDNEMKSKYERS